MRDPQKVFLSTAPALISTIVAALLTSMALPSPSAADAPKKTVDFLFSEDNQIDETAAQFTSSIEPKPLLREDKWLNAPLTRLDYVLINIQSQLNTGLSAVAQHVIQEYFEAFYPGEPPSVEFSARYSDEKGRIILAASVDTVGKPKKPMKEFCQSMMGWIERSYPLKPLGYLWYNNALGLLMRDDADKYSDAVQKLTQSAIISVHVSSSYASAGKRGFFSLGCMRQVAGGPITFYKYSSVLSDTP